MSHHARVAIEICVDDLAGALDAEANGADRIELCAGLSEGGVTPSLGLVKTVVARVPRIGIQVMIRPRGGDFTASPDELDVMLADITLIRALAPDPRVGFVFGVLDGGNAIDMAAIQRLTAACGDAPTTFHKAFDLTPDQRTALDALASLGIQRVLTSGGAGEAADNGSRLRDLVHHAAGRIVVLAGGGIRVGNVRALIAETGVAEIHLRAMRPHPTRPPVTSSDAVAAVVASVRHHDHLRS